jgi:hypothetical protein
VAATSARRVSDRRAIFIILQGHERSKNGDGGGLNREENCYCCRELDPRGCSEVLTVKQPIEVRCHRCPLWKRGFRATDKRALSLPQPQTKPPKRQCRRRDNPSTGDIKAGPIGFCVIYYVLLGLMRKIRSQERGQAGLKIRHFSARVK